MSNEEPDHPTSKSQVHAAHLRVTLWILQKDTKRLRCELSNNSPTGGWEMHVFDEGELCFAQRWALEGSARFFAASLKRERLRKGWSELPLPTAWSGKAVSVNDDLAFLARNNCVFALDLMSNLNDALNVLHCPKDYEFINVDELPSTDVRRGYPSPTLLWRGKEIFGMPVPTPPFQPC